MKAETKGGVGNVAEIGADGGYGGKSEDINSTKHIIAEIVFAYKLAKVERDINRRIVCKPCSTHWPKGPRDKRN